MADISPVDDESRVLHLPTRRMLRWMEREMRALMDTVPHDLWPDDECQPTGAIDLEAAMKRLTRLLGSGQDIEPLFWQLARTGFLLRPAGIGQQQELQRARELIDRVIQLRPH